MTRYAYSQALKPNASFSRESGRGVAVTRRKKSTRNQKKKNAIIINLDDDAKKITIYSSNQQTTLWYDPDVCTILPNLMRLFAIPTPRQQVITKLKVLGNNHFVYDTITETSVS